MVELWMEYIYKYYDQKEVVVDDFNFYIVDKEFIVFVGLFGCGKLMMFWMVVGFEEILKGDFYIEGKCVNDVVLKDRDIVMVF